MDTARTTVVTMLPSRPNSPPFNSAGPDETVLITLAVRIPLTSNPNTHPWKKFQAM